CAPNTPEDRPNFLETHSLRLFYNIRECVVSNQMKRQCILIEERGNTMRDERTAAPDGTAVRGALWRAMHVEVDPPPPVVEDEIGLKLAAPDEGWRQRPDMDPHATSGFRASIVARARFIEDLVAEQVGHGVSQYIILGAGLDTFAQRRPEITSRLKLFEVDQPGPQAWKRQRLIELGFGIPEWLRLLPVRLPAGAAFGGRSPSAPLARAKTGAGDRSPAA